MVLDFALSVDGMARLSVDKGALSLVREVFIGVAGEEGRELILIIFFYLSQRLN